MKLSLTTPIAIPSTNSEERRRSLRVITGLRAGADVNGGGGGGGGGESESNQPDSGHDMSRR